jgi:hypothetical protein
VEEKNVKTYSYCDFWHDNQFGDSRFALHLGSNDSHLCRCDSFLGAIDSHLLGAIDSSGAIDLARDRVVGGKKDAKFFGIMV